MYVFLLSTRDFLTVQLRTYFRTTKKIWENFKKISKLGCIEDIRNHKLITPLVRFYSSKSEKNLIGLDDYVKNMGEKPNAIYYLATDSLKSAKSAPFFKEVN